MNGRRWMVAVRDGDLLNHPPLPNSFGSMCVISPTTTFSFPSGFVMTSRVVASGIAGLPSTYRVEVTVDISSSPNYRFASLG